MSKPQISVVMPVHNVRPFVGQAIQSILTQTFADFEFVIVDDGSTDGSLEISREWAKKDERIRLIENRERLGHSATSNLAVSLTRADFVARMDADDISDPQRLAREWQIVSQSPDVVLVGTLADGIDTQGKPIRPRDRWRIVKRTAFAPFAHGSIMFRKDVFDSVSGYQGSTKRVGDQDLYHRMAGKGRIVTIPDVLYHYRYHLENSTLQRVPASVQSQNGYASRDSLYVEGAMRLWAGEAPGIFEEFRTGRFTWDLTWFRTAVVAGWGKINPASLRAVMRSGIWLRDRFAGIWIKDGKVYDWR